VIAVPVLPSDGSVWSSVLNDWPVASVLVACAPGVGGWYRKRGRDGCAGRYTARSPNDH
jgi:hypothetical protein